MSHIPQSISRIGRTLSSLWNADRTIARLWVRGALARIAAVCVAGALGLAGLVAAEIGAFLWLSQRASPVESAACLSLINLLLAAIVVAGVWVKQPSWKLEAAREVRKMALELLAVEIGSLRDEALLALLERLMDLVKSKFGKSKSG